MTFTMECRACGKKWSRLTIPLWCGCGSRDLHIKKGR